MNVALGAEFVGADMIFVSSDAVHSGDARPCDENTEPDPVWDYGRWKVQAERAALSEALRSAVVRLPLVVSLDPEDRAVQRIRTASLLGRASRWADDETRQPAMASDIADGLWRIATLPPDERGGARQLPGPESLTRYGIAWRVRDALKLDPRSVMPVATPSDVVRPRHVHMSCERARDVIGGNPERILT